MNTVSGSLTRPGHSIRAKRRFPYTREQLNHFKEQHRAKLVELGVVAAIAETIAQETIAPELEELESSSEG